MILEILIPSLSALLACIYFNRDDFSGEEDVIGRRYPCEKIDFKILKYLSYNRTAIMFMVLGVIRFNFTWIISTPIKFIRKITVRILKKFLL